MTQKQYIEEVAKYVKKYAPQYGIKVYSPIIAQFCLESGYGTSNKVKKVLDDGTIDWRHNYVGLKWRNNRCAISNNYFEEGTSEQNKDGSYIGITSKFFRFKSLEECVIGYFQFTNISAYANLKGVTDPETYLKNIKEDKYATSIDYVQKNMNVISKWNLTQYDKKEESKMGYKVAIDAGHGSNTAGKRTVTGYREHWCNVKTANYFDIAMKRCGLETVKIAWDDTNATDDTDVSLTKRQQQIKNAKCDISVSWHANAHGDGKTYTSGQGIETLIHENPARVGDSRALANKVQTQLIKGTTQKNRGVKAMSLSMCNCIAMGTKASILIEIGFMTNQYEEQLIQTDAFCLECAEEAAKGVCEYLGVVYKSRTNNVSSITNTTTTTYPAKTYTVVSGDTLSKIGTKTGVNWKVIAELNGIKAPYIIKKGQVLKLSEGATQATTTPSTTPNTSTTTSTTVPLKITQSKKEIQKFLNTYYGTEIKKVVGALLSVDGDIGNKSKLALGVAIQVELNKLGAGLDIDGKIGSKSATAWNKYIGTLKSGSRGIFVTLWQCILVGHNYDPNGIDGSFGKGCKNATDNLFGKIGLTKDSSVSGSDINALL